MNNKSPLLFFYFIFTLVFILLGFLALFSGIPGYISDRRLRIEGIPVSGVISNIETYTDSDSDGVYHTYHRAFVSYDVCGKNYKVKLSDYNFLMHEGDPITLYYLSDDDPSSADYVSLASDMIVLIILGGIFGVIGIGFGIAYIRNILKKRLLSTGISVMANVTYCGYGNVKIDDRRTYVVKCEWTDESGIYHAYKSGPFMYDPTDKLLNNQVEVFVNPNNYNKYCVNL